MVNRHTASVENRVRAPGLALPFTFAYTLEFEDEESVDLLDVVLTDKTHKYSAPHVEIFLDEAKHAWTFAKRDASKLCERFHYSHFLPPLTRGIGIWRDGESDLAVAACCFGGAPARVWSQYPILELNRLVRREDVTAPLTGLISETVKGLRWAFPKYKLLISYADRTEGHTGWIYQASSWNYAGTRESIAVGTKVDGEFHHQRTMVSTFGSSSPDRIRELGQRALTMRRDGFITKDGRESVAWSDIAGELKIEPAQAEACSKHIGAIFEVVKDEGKHVYWKPLRRGGEKLAAQLKLGKRPYPKEVREGSKHIQRSELKEPDLDEAL